MRRQDSRRVMESFAPCLRTLETVLGCPNEIVNLFENLRGTLQFLDASRILRRINV